MRKFRPSLITAALMTSGFAFASLPLLAQEAAVEVEQAAPEQAGNEIEKIRYQNRYQPTIWVACLTYLWPMP
jgi:hypothetical protein